MIRWVAVNSEDNFEVDTGNATEVRDLYRALEAHPKETGMRPAYAIHVESLREVLESLDEHAGVYGLYMDFNERTFHVVSGRVVYDMIENCVIKMDCVCSAIGE